ncbi:MAG: Na(+)/H(+) antiporter subunit B [Pseudomonadota bacterium]
MDHHYILRVVSALLIPVIMLFGLYVQFHGDFGPGGGFQAGVIFAAALVLNALVFGLQRTKQVVSPAAMRIGASFGVLLYAGVGVAGLLAGDNFLAYSGLAETAIAGQHLGILLVELGVGITVTSVMVSLFYCFAS